MNLSLYKSSPMTNNNRNNWV